MRPRGFELVVALALVGCSGSPDDIANGPDPLRALAQHVESSRYGPDYWKRVAEQNVPLWRKATAFCGGAEATEYPTCATVRMVDFLRRGVQPAAPPDPFTFRSDHPRDSTDGHKSK